MQAAAAADWTENLPTLLEPTSCSAATASNLPLTIRCLTSAFAPFKQRLAKDLTVGCFSHKSKWVIFVIFWHFLLCGFWLIWRDSSTPTKTSLCNTEDIVSSLAWALSLACVGSAEPSFCALGRLGLVARGGSQLLKARTAQVFAIKLQPV